ncbi:hypothetical protein COL5a_001033 [Colletotrichum fioriniae]|nr:uncharacterized protein COL516b_005882 [Colletotrichum fioriniae]KAJ0304525.1 hypothetical protein COL516b_005882 [Colletotrichum fioriniae]KAJ0333329.1 hypothetical protein COL5a_001033 [Colletotrichum fioriniae]
MKTVGRAFGLQLALNQQIPDIEEESNVAPPLQRSSSIMSGVKTAGRVVTRSLSNAKNQTKNLVRNPSSALRGKKEGKRHRQTPEQVSGTRTSARVHPNEPATGRETPFSDIENVATSIDERSRQQSYQRAHKPLSEVQERVPSASAQKSQGHERSKSGGSGQASDKTKKRFSASYLVKRRSEAEFKKRSSADQIEKRRSVGNLTELLSEAPENAPGGSGWRFSVALRPREV